MPNVKPNPDTGGASPLIRRVLEVHAAKRLIRAIEDGRRRVDLSGLRGSSPALLIEATRASLGRPVVVCCADAEKAHDAFSDLKTLSTASVHLFPEKDIFPQSFELKENLTVRGQRNACLDLTLRDGADIVVLGCRQFAQ